MRLHGAPATELSVHVMREATMQIPNSHAGHSDIQQGEGLRLFVL
jgi:hypothetical protein